MNNDWSDDAIDSVETALAKTIRQPDLSEVVYELAEVGIDQLIEEGFARDIPILGTVVGLARIGLSIRDLQFMKKLHRFLAEIQTVPQKERQKFVDKMNEEEGFEARVGEDLLLLLERLDSMKKPQMVGRIFKAWLEGRIDEDTHQRLQHSVDRINIHSVPRLIEFYNVYFSEGPQATWRDSPINNNTFQDLVMAGLIDMKLGAGFLLDESADYEQIAQHARLFIEIALEHDLPN